jgi:uncharacterized protein involved in exopolysaccharide biosynthesis
MDMMLYIRILRQSWLLIVLIVGAAAVASLAVALTRPQAYQATARLLVTFADPARVDIEDPLAYDVAAIVRGRPFGTDVAAALANQGFPITADVVMASLQASNTKREVLLSANATDPVIAIRLLEAAVAQLKSGGLRYWGAAPIVAEQPGLSVVVLDLPTQATATPGMRSVAQEVGLRAIAALAVALLIAFARHYLSLANRSE